KNAFSRKDFGLWTMSVTSIQYHNGDGNIMAVYNPALNKVGNWPTEPPSITVSLPEGEVIP
ncbi:MAG: hypothetical protein KDC88_16625, partial [Ignavibacteriae bacterium]|nr:hypothetical protein [Ignavibacteriota bacterium]